MVMDSGSEAVGEGAFDTTLVSRELLFGFADESYGLTLFFPPTSVFRFEGAFLIMPTGEDAPEVVLLPPG